MIIYHVTNLTNLSSIKRRGLCPQIGLRSQELGETEKCIFVFTNLDDVDEAVANWLGDEFDDNERLFCITINVPDSWVKDSDVGYEKRIYHIIKPDHFVKINEIL